MATFRGFDNDDDESDGVLGVDDEIDGVGR